jgi:hypothetical protein
VTIGTFKLFAELIATHLDAFDRLEASEVRLNKRQNYANNSLLCSVTIYAIRSHQSLPARA